MRPDELERELEDNEAGLSFPERKGRRKSPYRKKQLDYEHQMRPHVGSGGEDRLKIARVLRRIGRQLNRRALDKIAREAESDEESALTAAESIKALKRSRFRFWWTYRGRKVRLRDSIREKAKYRTPKRQQNRDDDKSKKV